MNVSGTQERGTVEVISGTHSHGLPLAGLTVGEARAELIELMHIVPEMVSTVDGKLADESTRLAAGQVLCFMRPTANKC